MERLTEKVNGEYIHKVHKFCLNDCYNKLGKLEDLQDELGIPLEVLFKALKDGIIMDDEEYRTFLMYDEVTNSYCFKCGGWGKYFLKDYGKTWWLEKPIEESE